MASNYLIRNSYTSVNIVGTPHCRCGEIESNKHYFSDCRFIVVSGQLSDKALVKYMLLILRHSFLVTIISPLMKMKRSFTQSMFTLLKAGDSLKLQFTWHRIICFSL